MADYQIKWNRSDTIKLGKAVANFNKKINELKNEENELYLPDTLTYAEEKENITTRRELNRRINSLKRFLREGAEELYTTRAGEEITKWERQELSYQKTIATRRLQKELASLYIPKVRPKIFTCANGITKKKRT